METKESIVFIKLEEHFIEQANKIDENGSICLP